MTDPYASEEDRASGPMHSGLLKCAWRFAAAGAKRPAALVGCGTDIHRLVETPEAKLVLAGVTVATGVGPQSHSDGDVVCHALCDALLGAMGFGDIGEHFDDNDPQWENAHSVEAFLRPVVRAVAASGMAVANVDCSIIAERPKLAAFKSPMVEALAAVLGTRRVSVKAGTNEGLDALGRGEAISCNAVALLTRAG